jgi:hypothetical protein
MTLEELREAIPTLITLREWKEFVEWLNTQELGHKD